MNMPWMRNASTIPTNTTTSQTGRGEGDIRGGSRSGRNDQESWPIDEEVRGRIISASKSLSVGDADSSTREHKQPGKRKPRNDQESGSKGDPVGDDDHQAKAVEIILKNRWNIFFVNYYAAVQDNILIAMLTADLAEELKVRDRCSRTCIPLFCTSQAFTFVDGVSPLNPCSFPASPHLPLSLSLPTLSSLVPLPRHTPMTKLSML